MQTVVTWELAVVLSDVTVFHEYNHKRLGFDVFRLRALSSFMRSPHSLKGLLLVVIGELNSVFNCRVVWKLKSDTKLSLILVFSYWKYERIFGNALQFRQLSHLLFNGMHSGLRLWYFVNTGKLLILKTNWKSDGLLEE